MARLNGWQRLWVVASLVSALVVIPAASESYPTAQREWQWHLFDQQYGSKEYAEDGTVMDRWRSDAAFVARGPHLIYRQVGFVVKVALTWAVCCLAVYAFGWSLGWIYRGFRPKAKPQV